MSYLPITEYQGILLDDIPGESLGDKFIFMNMFDWNYVPGCLMNEKFDYIISIREDAFNKQIDIVEYITIIVTEYGQRIPNYEYTPQFSYNSDIRDILIRAVHTQSAPFVAYLMERIIYPFLDGVGLLPYINSFRRPFIEAILYHNQDITDVLYQYYSPEMDVFFRDEALYHVMRTDDPLGYYLLQLYCDGEYTFWKALNINAARIAEYILSQQVADGHFNPSFDRRRMKRAIAHAYKRGLTKVINYLETLHNT